MKAKWTNRMQTIQRNKLLNYLLRYSASVLVVIIAFWLYSLMTAWFGPGLPTYILFYPAVIIVAILLGLGPGLLATILSVIIVVTWILPPVGIFSVPKSIDEIGVVLFITMGVLISSVAELYRSNRKKAIAYDKEMALQESEAKIQTLFEYTPAGMALFDAKPPYTVLVHNKYYQEFFAEPFRSKGMIGLNIYDYAPEVEVEGVVAVFDEVVRTKKPVEYLDFPYNSNPPNQSWLDWYMLPVIVDGKIISLVSMSVDVTSRHKMKESLQESYERFNLAQKVSSVGTFEWNIQTGVNTWTPELEAMYGLQEGEFPGTQEAWKQLLHPEDMQEAIHGVDIALETGARGS